MTHLLATNTCIVYLGGRSPSIKRRLLAQVDADIAVCAPVKAELYFGSERSRDPIVVRTRQDFFLSRFVSLAFDDVAAHAYGRARADLANRSPPIGLHDLLIASIALVTHNIREFSRVTGLILEDWELA